MNGLDLVVLRWRRHPSSVGRARAELGKALAGWGLDEVADTATVVLSELLTNAVRHARVPADREIETRFQRLNDGLRIEVHDAADTRPVLREPDAEAECGRGLGLVDALADRWDVSDRAGCGKAVWAELTGPGAGSGCRGA